MVEFDYYRKEKAPRLKNEKIDKFTYISEALVLGKPDMIQMLKVSNSAPFVPLLYLIKTKEL